MFYQALRPEIAAYQACPVAQGLTRNQLPAAVYRADTGTAPVALTHQRPTPAFLRVWTILEWFFLRNLSASVFRRSILERLELCHLLSLLFIRPANGMRASGGEHGRRRCQQLLQNAGLSLLFFDPSQACAQAGNMGEQAVLSNAGLYSAIINLLRFQDYIGTVARAWHLLPPFRISVRKTMTGTAVPVH